MPKIEMKNISIEFPGVKALSDVHFAMESGKIHALIGANGAGKSTLMKVLSGAYPHFTGSIWIDGREVTIKQPKDAKSLGIEIVYQEVDTALIPYLDVGENIMLDVMVNKMKGRSLIHWRSIYQRAEEVLQQLHINLDPKVKVNQLSLAQKQMVLIARAIVESRKFLILDEPTAPLSHRETEELFRIVRQLATHRDVGIIFISHRLPELFQICEDITIMKDGKIVTSQSMEGLTPKKVVEYMLGQTFHQEHAKKRVSIGEPVLDVKSLYEKNGKVKDVTLSVHAGEIVGIAGLVGAGKTELCKTLFGALVPASGEIRLKQQKVSMKSPYQAVKQRIAFVPEERRKEGVLVGEPVYSNLSAASLAKFLSIGHFLKPMREKQAARDMIQEIGIKTPNENQKVAFLSGGNQQKVAIGKWLMADADVYIFDEPTKGVDVGAKGDLFDLIGDLAASQKAILYASSELTEIMAITDRVYVMYDGRIVKELITANTTEEDILYYSTGGN